MTKDCLLPDIYRSPFLKKNLKRRIHALTKQFKGVGEKGDLGGTCWELKKKEFYFEQNM